VLVDTHCHLTFDALAADVDGVLARAHEAGVRRFITVATDLADARAALALLEHHSDVSMAAGIHPHEAGKATQDDFDALRDLHHGRLEMPVALDRLVAVGESGLDFHYDFAPRARQEEVFRFQLELACEVSRPVIIHARESEELVADILIDFPRLAGRVVFHCFSADARIARRILDQGCWISFTGVATFKNADAIREAARIVPDDRIMVETDSPYLSPVPIRNKRPCEPAFVTHTARRLAELRGVAFEDFANLTTQNAVRFFNLAKDAT